MTEVKHSFDEDEAPGADTAEGNSNHTHGYANGAFDESEGYADQYSETIAHKEYATAGNEPTDYDTSSSPYPGSYSDTTGGYDESNAAVYAGAGEYEDSSARGYIDPTDPYYDNGANEYHY